MHRLMTVLAAMLLIFNSSAAPKSHDLKSPDGKLIVSVNEDLYYTLTHESDLLLDKSNIGMYMTDGAAFGECDKLVKVSYRSVDQTIDARFYKKP